MKKKLLKVKRFLLSLFRMLKVILKVFLVKLIKIIQIIKYLIKIPFQAVLYSFKLIVKLIHKIEFKTKLLTIKIFINKNPEYMLDSLEELYKNGDISLNAVVEYELFKKLCNKEDNLILLKHLLKRISKGDF